MFFKNLPVIFFLLIKKDIFINTGSDNIGISTPILKLSYYQSYTVLRRSFQCLGKAVW